MFNAALSQFLSLISVSELSEFRCEVSFSVNLFCVKLVSEVHCVFQDHLVFSVE